MEKLTSLELKKRRKKKKRENQNVDKRFRLPGDVMVEREDIHSHSYVLCWPSFPKQGLKYNLTECPLTYHMALKLQTACRCDAKQ